MQSCQLKGKLSHYRERSRDHSRGQCLQACFLGLSVVCPGRKREVGGQNQVNGKKDRLPAGKMVRILHTPWPLPGIAIQRANLWDSFLTPWDWARFEQAQTLISDDNALGQHNVWASILHPGFCLPHFWPPSLGRYPSPTPFSQASLTLASSHVVISLVSQLRLFWQPKLMCTPLPVLCKSGEGS